MNKILVVDDEIHMRQLLKIYLQQYGNKIDEAANGQEAYDKIQTNDYDLVILDVMMPLLDGWQTLEKIREKSDIPVLMLTAKEKTEDKVTGLTAGADDYLVKPFEEAELVARIQAILRRTQKKQENDQILKYKGLIMNVTSREVYYKENEIRLTQTEFDILQALIEHKGKVLSREQLIDHIWGIEFMGEDRTIDSHVKNLREKLRKSGIEEQLVQTVWGIGYKAP